MTDEAIFEDPPGPVKMPVKPGHKPIYKPGSHRCRCDECIQWERERRRLRSPSIPEEEHREHDDTIDTIIEILRG
jgi:hypothetical protein